MLLCGMNFINLIRIQFIFGIEDQLILSYNPNCCFVSLFRFPAFLQSILATVQNDDWRREFHNEGNVKRHNEENDNSGPAVDNIQYPVPVFLFPWKFMHFNGGIPFIKTTLMV